MKFRRCEIEFVNTQKGILEQWYAFKVFTGVKPAPYGAVDGEWKWRTAFDRDQALAKAKELHATTPPPPPPPTAAQRGASDDLDIRRPVTLPPCPACEAAARERDAAYEDARMMQERLRRLIDAEPQKELADLRAQIEALANEMETAERGVRLQYWIIRLRKIAEKEAGENGMDILDRAIDRIEEHSWTQDGPMSDEDDAAIDLLKECMEAVERELLAEKEAK